MKIRNAPIRDLADIRRLPVKLGHPDTAELGGRLRLQEMLDDPTYKVLAWEDGKKAQGLPGTQTGFFRRGSRRGGGNYAFVSLLFAVERYTTSLNIAAEMEELAEQTALEQLSGQPPRIRCYETHRCPTVFPRRRYE